ncbi:MAG: hypothetical protein WKF83_13655 [Nocardioidaceae bacterium]
MIGYDARHQLRRSSPRDTAEVMTGAGAERVPAARTAADPAARVTLSGTSACRPGSMVTASHNPPRDNGYKVYLGDGSQIVPPADADIAAAIAAVGPVDALPRSLD